MSETPEKCPTCGTAVPPGAVRCPSCGRVFGEANRCPHCHAIAAVRRSGAGYVCVACGKPRELGPGTTVLGGGGAMSAAPPGVDPASRSIATLMRAVGGLLVLAAIAAGAVAALGPGAPVALLATIAVVLGVGGVTALSQAGGVERRSEERRARQIEQRLLALAEKRGGDVVATDAAKALGIGLGEADAALTKMSDGTRVVVEVDGEGIVHYVFREIAARRVRRVRVDPAAEQEAIEAEAAERVSKEIEKRGRI